MNLEALQARLRQFAAERDWQGFHTPKNLAMALMVEAAELAELFQWLTPEQSLAARSDLALQRKVGDELADVLLYLAQLADHSGVDLERAVAAKLQKNARKHPPLHSRPRSGAAELPPRQTHVLLDYENVQPDDATLRALVPDVTDLWLFHGPHQTRIDALFASFGDRVTRVAIARPGKNSLDFHLSFYMGYIAANHPDARLVVLANDQGYAPMLEHAEALGFEASLVGHARARRPAARTVARKAAPARPRATTKPAAAPAEAMAAPAGPPPVAAKAAAGKAARAAPAKPPARLPARPRAKPPAKAPARPPARPPATPPARPPSTASAKAAPKSAAKPAARPAAQKVPARRPAATLHKLAEQLRRLGDALPRKLAPLRRLLQSLLGTTADAAAVQTALSGLVAAGLLAVDERGAVSYTLTPAPAPR